MFSMAMGSRAFNEVAGAASVFRMPSKITAAVEPPNGTVPVAISYSTTPSENKSDRKSSASPRACSGDI
jgi:hypothetical protein